MKIKFYPINKILRSEIPNCLKNYLEPWLTRLKMSEIILIGHKTNIKKQQNQKIHTFYVSHKCYESYYT